MLKVLRQRNFTLLWLGQLISIMGDWILWIALPFYIYGQTGSTLVTGAMFAVEILPAILFGSLAGVFVDRRSRKWTMIWADLLRAFILISLVVASSYNWLWIVHPIIFIQSTISQFFNPAKNAIIPTLVSEENLMAANTLNSFGEHLASLLGPALGGTMALWLGLTGVVFVDSVTFLISGLMILLIIVPSEPEKIQLEAADTSGPNIWTKIWWDWLAGLRLVKRESLIAALFIIVGVTMVGQGIIHVLWIAFVREMLGGSAWEYGMVQVTVTAGGLVGTLIVRRVSEVLTMERLISLSGLALGLLFLATFNLPSLPIILVLQFLAGLPAVGFFITICTMLQANTANHYLGRVFGAYNTTNALLVLIGQGLAGALGNVLGIVPMLNISACLYFLGGIIALVLLSRKISTTEQLINPTDALSIPNFPERSRSDK